MKKLVLKNMREKSCFVAPTASQVAFCTSGTILNKQRNIANEYFGFQVSELKECFQDV